MPGQTDQKLNKQFGASSKLYGTVNDDGKNKTLDIWMAKLRQKKKKSKEDKKNSSTINRSTIKTGPALDRP